MPARTWGVWCTPTKTNKVGQAGWMPDRDYDTGRRGWTKAEAARQARYHNTGVMRKHWEYEVREHTESDG